MLEKQQKNKKEKKVHAVFYQVGSFIQWYIDLFILKNMGAAIIDFRVCPPLVKCKSLMFSGFIDTHHDKNNKKEKKVHAVFYQVGFILILYGENNDN
jgi:hypothetical protein